MAGCRIEGAARWGHGAAPSAWPPGPLLTCVSPRPALPCPCSELTAITEKVSARRLVRTWDASKRREHFAEDLALREVWARLWGAGLGCRVAC